MVLRSTIFTVAISLLIGCGPGEGGAADAGGDGGSAGTGGLAGTGGSAGTGGTDGCELACEITEICTSDGCASPMASLFHNFAASVFDFAFGPDGGVVVVGGFRDSVDFGFGPASPATARGDTDVFVAKYSAVGALQWFSAFGGSSDNFGRAVAIDADDNVYVSGSLRGFVNFGPGGNMIADGSDVLILSYNPRGSIRWGNIYASSTTPGALDQATGIAVGADRVYITGTTGRGTDFGGGSLGNLNDSKYMFVAAFDVDDGAHVWSEGYDYDTSPGTNHSATINDLAIDSNENLFVAGSWRGSFDFGAGQQDSSERTNGMTTTRTDTAFIASYTGSSGVFRWAQTIDGVNRETATARPQPRWPSTLEAMSTSRVTLLSLLILARVRL